MCGQRFINKTCTNKSATVWSVPLKCLVVGLSADGAGRMGG